MNIISDLVWGTEHKLAGKGVRQECWEEGAKVGKREEGRNYDRN